MTRFRTSWLSVFAPIAILSLGCTNPPGRIEVPRVDPVQAASEALSELDANGDQILQADELEKCPALAHAKGVYDVDRNGELSEQEIVDGIGRWASARTGAVMLPFRVELDGKPLVGAELKLVPVSFMRGELKPARGSTDRYGAGMLELAPEDRPSDAPNVPLVPPGLYRVEITHPQTIIPTQFNTESGLGLETSVAAMDPAGVVWKLHSKKKVKQRQRLSRSLR